ncbi:MAG: multiprotein bridging factor aMBF1 [Candidatus Micrarchaeota archaeon]
MDECEICGKAGGDYYVLIEGAKLYVCASCAKLGKVLRAPAPRAPPKKFTGEKKTSARREIELVPDFGERIRNARKKMHLERAVLGEMINEKESFLERVENDKAVPTEALARKLEKALGIKLLEEVTYGEVSGKAAGAGGVTLGDIVFLKKKEKGEEEE